MYDTFDIPCDMWLTYPVFMHTGGQWTKFQDIFFKLKFDIRDDGEATWCMTWYA